MGVQLDILGGDDEAREAYSGIPASFYAPILKFKAGELTALRTLIERQNHPRLLPIFEMLPQDESDSSDRYIDSVVSKLRSSWPDRVALMDTGYLDEDLERSVLHAAVDLRLPLVVVIPSDRTDKAVLQLAKAAAELGLGAALRLRAGAATDPDELPQRLEALRELIGFAAQDLDLIVDYGFVGEMLPAARHMRRLLPSLEPLDHWRSFVLSSSAFPTNLGQLGRYRLESIERLDWRLWTQLLSGWKSRMPSYSDYTIANPEVPPGGRQAPHNLRYATEQEWVILKGARPQKGVVDADFMALFEDFASSRDFAGDDFSWGDEFIAACARQRTLRGNATTWRAVGVSHHLETVLRQLRSITS